MGLLRRPLLTMKFALLLLSLLPIVPVQSQNSTCHGGADPDFHNSTTTHHPPSTVSQCHHLSHLQALTSLASNAIRIAAATHNNTAEASAIQASASAAASALATLTANSTFVALCDRVAASEAAKASCRALAGLEQLAAALAAANNSATVAGPAGAVAGAGAPSDDAVRSGDAAAAAELARLRGNAPLTALCAALKTNESCAEMERLQRMVGQVANGTVATTGGEGGRGGRDARKGKEWIERAQAKLDELKGNATLVAVCGAVGAEEGKATERNLLRDSPSHDPFSSSTAFPYPCCSAQFPLRNMYIDNSR